MSDGHDPGPRRQLLAALVLLVVLVAGSLWIIGALRGASAIQDCVQAGRSNCAPVDAPGR